VTGNSQHPDEDDLILFFYGESGAPAFVAPHVKSCEACQATLRALQRTMAVVDRHCIPERDAGYGAEVWARVQDRLARPSHTSWAAGSWMAWFAPRRLLLAGGVAVLLVAAFLAGRYWSVPSGPQIARGAQPPTGAANVAAPEVVRDRVLLVAVGDHLERSQMVLIELMNKAPDGPVDISATQEWARDLVPNNRLIRETADEAGERVVADVLDDLERTLVEIANSPSQLSKTEFDQVRQRIDGEGLVFKIRVLDSQVRAREQGSVRAVQSRS
jgi:hypothetical protein